MSIRSVVFATDFCLQFLLLQVVLHLKFCRTSIGNEHSKVSQSVVDVSPLEYYFGKHFYTFAM